jgi:hypothetical protein
MARAVVGRGADVRRATKCTHRVEGEGIGWGSWVLQEGGGGDWRWSGSVAGGCRGVRCAVGGVRWEEVGIGDDEGKYRDVGDADPSG